MYSATLAAIGSPEGGSEGGGHSPVSVRLAEAGTVVTETDDPGGDFVLSSGDNVVRAMAPTTPNPAAATIMRRRGTDPALESVLISASTPPT